LRIAIVEDDPVQAEYVKLLLQEVGHHTRHFSNAKDFMRNISHESYDMVILDWLLPDVSGDKVVKWMRSELDWYVPVLFVTVRDSEEDIVHGLTSGADDYMVKPIAPMELMARVEALGRRAQSGTNAAKTLVVNKFVFDGASKTLTFEDDKIDLTHKEFDLAYFLFRNIGRIMSRGYLLENIWGKNSDLNTRTVDTHISRLRTKLKLNQENGWKLGAIYQHGYRLEPVETHDNTAS
jgi:DNA-binding response OmpR family regulator